MIFNPQLPPKNGYVEIENENGNHVYQKIQSQIEKEEKEHEIESLKEQLSSTQDALDALLMGDVTTTT